MVLWAGCAALTWLSGGFASGSPISGRPIVPFVALLAALSVVYLASLRLAVRAPDQRSTGKTVLGFAIGFRLLVLFSTPIQEVDYYRYLWDGHAVVEGVNPYRYSPEQVLRGRVEDVPAESGLRRLIELRTRDARAATLLSRVHFGKLPTIYPPVSQAVFALSVLTTPRAAGVDMAVIILKGGIVLFDVGTLLLLMRLLDYVGQPLGWSLAYGWCPLIIKEFANSGHLDAIAVFFTVLAVYGLVRAVFPRSGSSGPVSPSPQRAFVALSAIGLSLAIGAKLYPVVLFPLLTLTLFRKRGLGTAARFTLAVALMSAGCCAPMFLPVGERLNSPKASSLQTNIPAGGRVSSEADGPAITGPALPVGQTRPPRFGVSKPLLSEPLDRQGEAPGDGPPVPTTSLEGQQDLLGAPDTVAPGTPAPVDASPQPSGKSLGVFLSRWKMNDLFVLFLEENLTPARGEGSVVPWFVVTPNRWRGSVAGRMARLVSVPPDRAPFLIARSLTAVMFVALSLWWAWRGAASPRAGDFLRMVFLTLAWFWLLSPTWNPWYWSWALPFIPFARQRAWLVVSGLLSLYYLRFYFAYEWVGIPVAGTPYEGEIFFHHVVVWFEHLPWLAALAAEALWKRWRSV